MSALLSIERNFQNQNTICSLSFIVQIRSFLVEQQPGFLLSHQLQSAAGLTGETSIWGALDLIATPQEWNVKVCVGAETHIL